MSVEFFPLFPQSELVLTHPPSPSCGAPFFRVQFLDESRLFRERALSGFFSWQTLLTPLGSPPKLVFLFPTWSGRFPGAPFFISPTQVFFFSGPTFSYPFADQTPKCPSKLVIFLRLTLTPHVPPFQARSPITCPDARLEHSLVTSSFQPWPLLFFSPSTSRRVRPFQKLAPS